MGRFRIAWVLLLGGLGHAQSQPSPEVGPDVRLEVRTRGNQSIFRIGEIIPLELRFSSTVESKYLLEMRTADRSGRISADTYAVEPRSGWRDSLGDYFRTGAFMAGGIGPVDRMLTADPITIAADLNEWVRFDRPGQYRVAVTSRRVTIPNLRRYELKPDGSVGLSGNAPLAVVSNPVLLTVIAPPPEWQQTTLRAALAELGEPVSAPPGAYTPARRDAIRVLRFLGTAEAAHELAQRIYDPICVYGDCELGLAGFHARKLALEELSKELRESGRFQDTRWSHVMSVLATPEDVGGR